MMNYSKLKEANADLLKKYDISSSNRSDEYYKILNSVKKKVFENVGIDAHPSLIFADSTLESGRSSLVKAIKKTFPSKDFVVLDINECRMYHPDLSEILQNPLTAALFTNNFAKNLQKDLLNYAISNGYNIIWNATLYSDSKVLSFLKKIPKHYTVELYVIACSAIESILSAELQFEQEISEGNCVPLFPDEAFMKKCDIYASIFLNEHLLNKFNTIRICKRNSSVEALPTIIYSSSIFYSDDIIEIIDNIEKCSVKKCVTFLNKLFYLFKKRMLRGASNDEINNLYLLSERLNDLIEDNSFDY